LLISQNISSAAPSTPSPSTTATSSLPYYETDFGAANPTTSTKYIKKSDLPPLDVLASPLPNRRLLNQNSLDRKLLRDNMSEYRISQSPLTRRKEYPLVEKVEAPPCDRLANILKDAEDFEMGDGSKFDRFSPVRRTTRRPLVRTNTKDGDLLPKEEQQEEIKTETVTPKLEKQTAVQSPTVEKEEPTWSSSKPTGINKSLAEMLTKDEPKLRRSSSESIKRPAFLSGRATANRTREISKPTEQPKNSSFVQRTQSLGRTAAKEDKPRLVRQLSRTPSQTEKPARPATRDAVERTNSISSLRSSKSSIASNPPSKQPVWVKQDASNTPRKVSTGSREVSKRISTLTDPPRKTSNETRFGFKPSSTTLGTGTQVKRASSMVSRPKRTDSISSKENLISSRSAVVQPGLKLGRSKPTSLSFMRPTAASTSKETSQVAGAGEPQSPGSTLPTSRIHRLAMKPVAQAKWT